MSFDDPMVWVLIVVIVVFLFGGNKIPSIARAMGEARREFDKGWRGEPPGAKQNASLSVMPSPDDPLVEAAQKEGISTDGKTKEDIASELSWKLDKK